MKKVLIVDDERAIREGMPYVIDWKAEGYEIIGSAENGIVGLEMIRQLKPDLVLLDIQMPGKTGLEMVKEAKEEGLEFYAIILSGYSDFEYAQTAIKLGAASYLLKPIDEDELLKILSEISAKLTTKQSENARYTLLEKLFGNDNSGFENYQYGKLIQSERPFSEDVLQRCITENQLVEHFYHHHKHYILLLSEKQTMQEVGEIKIAQSVITTAWLPIQHDLKSLVYEVERLGKYRFLYPKGEISTVFLEQEKQKYTFDTEVLKQICTVFLDDTDMNELWQVYKNNYFYKQDIDKGIKWQVLQDLNWLVDQVQSKFSIRFSWEAKEIQNDIYQTNTLTELIDCMKEEIDTIRRDLTNQLNTQGIIAEMIRYTENNYQKELSLKSIGEYFNYNSAYLGKKFRKEIGKTYLAYLEEIRMEKAKEILLHSNLMVYEIAEMVGYSNVDYFYKKFKSYFHLSPNEFRKNE